MEDFSCKRKFQQISVAIVDHASSSSITMSSKRRKVSVHGLREVQLQEQDCLSCCNFVASRLSSDDLKAKSFETESSTYIDNKFSRETMPLSVCGDTDEMESTAKPTFTSQQKLSAGKMPLEDEIDEFFAVAEKYEQMRFAEKYNYDIAKDVPLEGRYQWIRLKP